MSNPLDKLFEPIRDDEVEWRYMDLQQVARNDMAEHIIVPYLTATALRNRLDGAVGRENWTQTIKSVGEGAICALAIRVNGEWVSKEDGADLTEGNYKSMITRAFGRAGAAWGIGRDLYSLPTYHANYVVPEVKGAQPIRFGEQVFYHIPPRIAPIAPKANNIAPRPSVAAKADPFTVKKSDVKRQPTRPAIESRPDVSAQGPRFDQAPLGNKSQITQMKQEQRTDTQPIPMIPRVKHAQSNTLGTQAQQAEAPKAPETDARPWALEKIRFGMTKGKRFKDHTREELSGLIRYFTDVLPYPDKASVAQDKQRLIAFLGGKLELPAENKQA